MRCIHCGNQVQASELACRHCGARVVRPSVDSPARGSSPRLIAIAGALLVIGIAAAIILPNRHAVLALLDELQSPPSVPAAPAAVPTPPPTSKMEAASPASPTPIPAALPRVEGPARPARATPAPTPTERRPTSARGPVTGTDIPRIPDAPPPPATARRPTRVGGNIPTPTKIRDVRPVYPAMAQQARVQGLVIIEATIGTEGNVTDARVLRSIPLLDESALDAVRQWVFTPTLLNGVPVPVIMTVTVQFTLQ